jgi:hypothetical protein
MSDRLTELQRQRALIQEHLAWLDREIATAQGKPLPPPLVASQLAPANAPQATATLSPPNEPEVEKIISQYHKDPGLLNKDTKRGCLIAFGLAMGVLAVGVLIAYWLYARHLGRWW